MELQVGVKILLKNSEGKYLLVKRNPKKYPEVGTKWDIVGGRIEPGSSLIENLKREIKEEVGLDYQDEPKLIAAQDIIVPPFNLPLPKGERGEGRHVVRLTYVGNIDGQPKIDEDHLEAGWFTKQEMLIFSETDLDKYLIELLKKEVIKI